MRLLTYILACLCPIFLWAQDPPYPAAPAAPQNIIAAEYFIDADPGFGLGTNIPLTAGLDVALSNVSINTTGLTPGVHNVYLRTRSAEGRWSQTTSQTFVIEVPYPAAPAAPQNIISAEYFIDADPGFGLGTNIPLTAGLDVALSNVSINTTGLTPGVHNVYLRTLSAERRWSQTTSQTFVIEVPYPAAPAAPQNIVAAEYFIDADPGFGLGTNIPLTAGLDVALTNVSVNTTGLAPGVHNVYLRTLSDEGRWSQTASRSFVIEIAYPAVPAAPQNIIAAEYFIDNDPGFGQGTSIPITSGVDVAMSNVSVSITGLSPGIHRVYLRTKSADNRWSQTSFREFDVSFDPAYPVASPALKNIVAAEYFIDIDPGFGLGTSIPFSAGIDVVLSNVTSDVTGLSPGVHRLYLRSKNGDGKWSLTSVREFEVNEDPVYPSAPAAPKNIVAAEYFIDSDPGFGQGANVPITASVDVVLANVVASVVGLSPGVHRLYLRSKNADGIWSLTSVREFEVNEDPIYPPLAPAAQNIVKAEYFIDTDPGFGQGTDIPLTASLDVVLNNVAMNTAGLSVGTHYAYTRVKSAEGRWSQTSFKTFEVLSTCPPDSVGFVQTACDSLVWNGQIYNTSGDYIQTFTNRSGCDSVVTLTLTINNSNSSSFNEIACVSYDWNGSVYTTTGQYQQTFTNVANCDSVVTLNLTITSTITWYLDADGDGWYVETKDSCETPGMGWTSILPAGGNGDCDDGDGTIHAPIQYYVDADGDGYGANTPVMLCSTTAPSGYSTNNTDCNDTIPGIHAPITYYVDADGDGYGSSVTAQLCSLTAPAGYSENNTDCDDADSTLNPGAQYLQFSGASNFESAICSPLNGTSYTNFTFEVIYFDANNELPPITFPRIYLDYEGNGNFANSNDRTIIMTPYDVNDTNTADGKRYVGTINSLANGTDWQVRAQVLNGGCLTELGPFNYPDVHILPDLEIYANDITFSSNHPGVSSPLTVSAEVHNVSDFAAQNFYAKLVNQYDTNIVYGQILVPNIAQHSSTTISWNITTPAVPAWCPMQVIIDYTDVIGESNELNNSAVRPFINGNYNLLGGITVVNAAASPGVSYITPNGKISVSGKGLYFGIPTPLADSSVAGATVEFTIRETGATYSTYSNSVGNFNFSFFAPNSPGVYHIDGTLTDFTFTGTFTAEFEMIVPVVVCLPDLKPKVYVSSNTIIEGQSISGSIVVANVGCAASTVTTSTSVNHSGGVPALSNFNVPPLNPGSSHTNNFNNLVFNTPGTYTICATADGGYVVSEANESNNTDCEIITVLPNQPELYPYAGPCCSSYLCNGAEQLSFYVGNSGGVASGPFTCEVIVRLNGTAIDTLTEGIANIDAQSRTSFSKSYTYPSIGNYTFELSCDVPLPGGVVVEYNENNNTATYSRNIYDCMPNLTFKSCETFDVKPEDPQFPGQVTYEALLVNNGNATAVGPIDVRFQLSGGTGYTVQYPGNLAAGQSAVITTNSVASVAPATQTLTVTADLGNAVAEDNESDNEITNSLCWDFEPVGKPGNCGSNFWDKNQLVNRSIYLGVGLNQYNLYDASAVEVKFEVSGPGLPGTVNLGNATVNNVQQSCYCPYGAALPYSFVFPQTGVYTVTMTADPDNVYAECNEANNVLVVQVVVTDLPDMRITSRFINPSLLNPDVGVPIHLDVTYENIGASNINDVMEMKILVDEIPLDSVYPVTGLATGDKGTISIPANWSSNVPGPHIVRAIIDNDDQIVESDEMNNEATRAVVVGQAANLYFQLFESSNPTPTLKNPITINARIGNNGDLSCEADVLFSYLNDQLDTIQIGTLHVNVSNGDSVSIQMPWAVLDQSTVLIGQIINSTQLEFTYDDNEASTTIGGMSVTFMSTPSCAGASNGTLTAVPADGQAPYTYVWSNGYNNQTLTGTPGVYTVTVTDNTGQSVVGTDSIVNLPGNLFYVDLDGDGIGSTTTALLCSEIPTAGYSNDSTDCNDADSTVWQSALLYVDADTDGYDAGTATVCYGATIPSGYALTTNGPDCDDADVNVWIGQTWYLDADTDGWAVSMQYACSSPGTGWTNTLPANGNGDCDDSDNSVWQSDTLFVDADSDDYDAGTAIVCYGATIPSGYSIISNGTDCDDADINIHAPVQYYVDSDGDGFGSTITAMVCSSTPTAGYSTTNTDCDDADINVWQSDSLYIDSDGDGYDVGKSSVCYGATVPSGYSITTNGPDCNDNDVNVWVGQTWYLDADADGWAGSMQYACSSPGIDWVNTIPANGNGDCDDSDNSVWQSDTLFVDADSDDYDAGTAIVCYGATIPSGYSIISNGTDCDDADINIHAPVQYYVDSDGDGFGSTTTAMFCSTPTAGYSINNTDCDDADINVWQSATLYVDADGDGYDAGTATVCYGATIPSGYLTITKGSDCDDSNPNIHPGATEICGNGIDEDCVGGDMPCGGGSSCLPISINFKAYGLKSFWENQGANDPYVFYHGISQWKRLSVNASGGTGPYTYSWSNSQGYTLKNQSTDGRSIQMFEPLGPSYNICEITDLGTGCVYTDSIFIDWDDQYYCGDANEYWKLKICINGVSTCMSWSQAKAAIKNGTGTLGDCPTTKSQISSSINPLTLEVYPNPTHGGFTLIGRNAKGESRIEIFDVASKRIVSEEIQNQDGFVTKTYDMNHLKAGVYFIMLRSSDEVATKKLMIVH